MKVKCLLILVLFSLLVSGCEMTMMEDGAASNSKSLTEEEKEELYESWSPENALAEAEKDIENGTVKIYYHGTVFASPAGVRPEEQDLIKDLPAADGGLGSVIDDMKLRALQGEYSAIYNNRILKWIKEKKD
ncbi:MAG: hypothetical protein ACYSSP_05160 [Planctomycetota bacterium]